MSSVFKTVFRRIGGRIIPMRKRIKGMGMQDEVDAAMEVRKARKVIKNLVTSAEPMTRRLHGAFFKATKTRSKVAGEKVAKRISRFARSKKKAA